MTPFLPARRSLLAAALVVAGLAAHTAEAARRIPNAYVAHNLVSDGAIAADHVDANLKNTWGVAFNPTGFVWVSNNGTGTSTLYDGLGNPQSLVVAVPAASGSGLGKPTGIVFSGSSDFVVGNGTATGPSRFIFASEDGLISGWAPNVDSGHALPAATMPGAIYKGLATAQSATGARLYATDFHNGRVDQFDAAFQRIDDPTAFVDTTLPHHFAPFGIQVIGDHVWVTYAKQDADAEDDVPGGGVVDVFTTEGRFLRRGAAQVGLDAPWGVALAPADFGHWSNRVLVSNFGDGTISAFDETSGAFLGRLRDADGRKLVVPGIWGIQFGNGVNSQPTNTLFFGAGPNHEADGVYGSITSTMRNQH